MEISISGRGLHWAAMKRLPPQLLRVMRLTALLLFIVSMHVSANTYSQTVSFSGKNVPLQTVFASFEKQTGLSFFFNYALIKDIKPVTVDVREMPLEDALSIILKEQGLSYYRNGKTVFIVKAEKAAIAAQTNVASPGAKQVDVAGRVTNQQGEGLAGASVETKDGKKATVTDAKGMFGLKNVPIGAMLIISYTGYQKKEISINDGVQQSVVLAIADNQLDKVQVIAYGSTTERLSTGNVTTVTAKEIEQQPVSNPLLALEGRVPGLFITQTNGMPGSNVTVRIQGQNSIQNGNDPFYVIDGVPYSSQALQSLSPSFGGNNLDFINPSDIESISVLKDADATAIYGSRAANGAILITTKKGKAGDTKVDFNLQNGYGHVTKEMPMMNTEQYIKMRLEAINNDGLTIQTTDYDINGTWDTTRNTNWQKVLIGGTAQYTNLNSTVSGGNVNIQYLVGGTYNRQTSVFPGNFADQKGTLHTSIATASANKKFHLQITGTYFVENNQLPGTDLSQTAYGLEPDAPTLYNADGSLNWALNQNGTSTWESSYASKNPLAYTLSKYENKNNSLVSNAVLSYQILPGLEIRSSFGYTNQQVNEILTIPLSSYAPDQRPTSYAEGVYTYNNNNSWIIEPQASFKKNWGKGKLDFLLGTTIQQDNTSQFSLTGYGYTTDLLLQNPQSAGGFFVSSSSSTYKYNAVFSRLNYSWDEKYLLNLTVRRDGSSRFGPANEFHDFGAIGAGWIFSKETAIQDHLSFLSFGKIKASYGTTGSDQINNYSFLSLYNTYPASPYQGIVSIVPSGLTNPYLQWEETKKAELGLDFGFLKDRILLSGTYVVNRSSNQLLGYNLPTITGFTYVERNFPATVQNSDWEFVVSTVNVKTTHFNWSSHLNLTIPKNKLVSFPGLASSSYASSLEIGKPITGAGKIFHLVGVNDTTGVYQFSDIKGNLTSTPNYGTDNYVFLSLAPKFYGGFENNFQYKGFELDILLQFVKQMGRNFSFGNYPGAFGYGNQPTYVINAWQKMGDHAKIQRYNTDYSYNAQFQDANNSDGEVSDASFIRLKNIALSWQLPLVGKNIFKNCRIYVQGQNLLTMTHYKGMDPENPTGGLAGLPPLRVLTGGVQVSF